MLSKDYNFLQSCIKIDGYAFLLGKLEKLKLKFEGSEEIDGTKTLSKTAMANPIQLEGHIF
jgi:hypothetical protein